MINNARHQQLEINDGEQSELARIVDVTGRLVSLADQQKEEIDHVRAKAEDLSDLLHGHGDQLEELSAFVADLIHQQQRIESAVTWLMAKVQEIPPGQPVTWKLAVSRGSHQHGVVRGGAGEYRPPSRQTGGRLDFETERQMRELYRQCWQQAGADGVQAVATAVNALFTQRAGEAGLPRPLSRWLWQWREDLSEEGMLIPVVDGDRLERRFATYWVKGDE